MVWISNAVGVVNDILWTYVLITLLIAAGLWFSWRTGFVQIRMLPEMVAILTDGVGTRTREGHISPFQAFCISTASRVGVGNIAGIAIAVVLGGRGPFLDVDDCIDRCRQRICGKHLSTDL